MTENLKNIADKAINEMSKQKIKDGESYVVHSVKHQVLTRAGKVETAERVETIGAGLRVKIDGRVGFAYSSETSQKALSEAVERAKQSAVLSREDEHAVFQRKGSDIANFGSSSDALRDITDAQRKETALKIADSAYGADPRIMYAEVWYIDFADETQIATTHGFEGFKCRGVIDVLGEIVARDGEEKRSAYDSEFSKKLSDLDAERFGRKLAQSAAEKLNPRSYPTGQYPLIFSSKAVSNFFFALESALSAENVLKRKTRLADKTGEEVAVKKFSLIDDGADLRGPFPSAMDDEGTASQRNVLIDKGVLKGFLHSLRTAKALKATPAGNGFRAGFSQPPKVSASQIFIEAGEKSFDDLIKETANGLLVEEVMGAHTIEAISGEFSLGAGGFAIRNGKKCEPVSGIAIASNLYEFLKKIAVVGADFRYFSNGVGAPSLLVDGITVSGAGK